MRNDSSVLLFFIDGLGIGDRIPTNPLYNLPDSEPLNCFKGDNQPSFLDGIVVPTDPCLGVEGRPQSASGQTTILTGINAPASLGYHKQGFPNQALLEIIQEYSIFKQLREADIGPITFANAYTPRFFNERPRWVSATTAAVEAAGLSFRTVDDLNEGNAVYQDFSNRLLIERGEQVLERSETEAAEVLARIVSANRFTLYEYFITDKAGHAQDMNAAREILTRLALFIRKLLKRIDLDQTTVLLTSDHGNIEDLSIRNHTTNMVPTIVWGNKRNRIAQKIKNLSHITPAIVTNLAEQP